MIAIEHLLLGAAILLLMGIIGSKASSFLGVPSLLFFLVLGMLAGSEGLGGIYFDDPWSAQFLGVLALILILFSGGLDTDWASVRPTMWKGVSLSTFGVLLTAVIVGLFAWQIIGFSLMEGLLLGAIVSSTDAAAVFSILRAKNVGLKGELTPLLELESGSNDPMAVFLTLGLIQLLTGSLDSIAGLIPLFFLQMAFGGLNGYVAGKAGVWLVNRIRLHYDGLYPVLTIALVLLTYGAATAIGGNGFLAVYVAGLVMGSSDFIHKRSLLSFHDGLAWLMQITMFLTLGLLVFPSRLLPVVGVGFLTALFLMLVARPLSVVLVLRVFSMPWRYTTLVAWVGLRGAVPIILATFPLLAGVPNAEMIFNMVFFIVLASVLLQGTSIPLMARWLRLDVPQSVRPRFPLEFFPTEGMKSEMVRLEIPANSEVHQKRIVELRLPPEVLILLINRRGDYIVPSGGTILQAGDLVLLLGESGSLDRVRDQFQRVRAETSGKSTGSR